VGQTSLPWNDSRALETIERARAVRQEASVDSALHSYRADARGFVYFFIDRADGEEPALIKADQIAIEMYWRAPDETRQRIVGLRDEKVLPTNIRYHLDHLTVVQDEFGDVIRIGDGDEVSDVTHPAAPGSDAVYDFRLTDSLTIAFPGAGADTVRVYEVQVRPKDFTRPGFVGTLFLDRSSGAIVRMNFTFTAASYVDPYLDYIRISLDNALWEGRHWLPYRQEAELRRELPQLDFLGGSVIRGRFEIGGYELNEDLSEAVFRSPRISAVPVAQRQAFPFERALFDDLEEQGLVPPPSLEEVRRQAVEMGAGRYLRGLAPARAYLPSASDALRYNRAEGLFLGAGVSFLPIPDLALRVHGGYAFSARHVSGTLEVRGTAPGPRMGLAAYANSLRDIGPIPGASGALNTLSVLLGGADYLDPYFASGVRATLPAWSTLVGRLTPASLVGSVSLERHRAATLAVNAAEGRFRPVRLVDEGDLLAADVRFDAGRRAGGWQLGSLLRYGVFDGDGYGRAQLEVGWARDGAWRDLALSSALHAGAVTGAAPAQELFLLGGRETLLGHPYRAFVGERFWLARLGASRTVFPPLLTARAFASAGWTGMGDRALPLGWTGAPTDGVKGSVGAGLGLAWNVLHLDVGRGLGPGGGWGVSISSSRRFRSWL